MEMRPIASPFARVQARVPKSRRGGRARFKAHAWRACRLGRVSGVQIPPSPPASPLASRFSGEMRKICACARVLVISRAPERPRRGAVCEDSADFSPQRDAPGPLHRCRPRRPSHFAIQSPLSRLSNGEQSWREHAVSVPLIELQWVWSFARWSSADPFQKAAAPGNVHQHPQVDLGGCAARGDRFGDHRRHNAMRCPCGELQALRFRTQAAGASPKQSQELHRDLRFRLQTPGTR
jgi:hypothetical protein